LPPPFAKSSPDGKSSRVAAEKIAAIVEIPRVIPALFPVVGWRR